MKTTKDKLKESLRNESHLRGAKKRKVDLKKLLNSNNYLQHNRKQRSY